MPAGKDGGSGRRGSTTKKNAFCSFCRKSYRDVGPLVEGPGDVYICGECIDLCQNILDQEQRRRGDTKQLFTKIPSPREIVAELERISKLPQATSQTPALERFRWADEQGAQFDMDNQRGWEEMVVAVQDVGK